MYVEDNGIAIGVLVSFAATFISHIAVRLIWEDGNQRYQMPAVVIIVVGAFFALAQLRVSCELRFFGKSAKALVVSEFFSKHSRTQSGRYVVYEFTVSNVTHRGEIETEDVAVDDTVVVKFSSRHPGIFDIDSIRRGDVYVPYN
jgi:hypothetical protein